MPALRFATILTAIWATSLALAGQQPAASEVEAMLRQAREEIRNFEKAGGKKEATDHPVQKWVPRLWTFREKSPPTPDAAKATSEAVHLLVHADRYAEVYARTDQLEAGDPAWEGLAQVLFEAASLEKNYDYLLKKLPSVIPNVTDRKIRAALHLALGRGWRAQKDEAKAKAAFEAATESARESSFGKQAETELYELLHLGPGQPAPQFSAKALNGSQVSLADSQGKPLVLVFWATH